MSKTNRPFDNPRIIISGGGTGGHIYPAIAIADAIRAISPTADILFVGALGKMEMEKVPLAGYKIIGLWISGFQRNLTIKNLLFPLKLVHSLFTAWRIITDFKPHVVVGVGGYASGAILRVAVFRNIPALIQEQNGYAGVTNKLLAQKVAKICVAYPDMEKYFPKEKIIFTGNPVRKDILNKENKKEESYQYFNFDPQKKTLLVIGGSLGARTINESLSAGIEKLLAADIQVLWQTGKFYFEDINALFANRKAHLHIVPFITKMDLAYAVADIVISRAGALSISELCLAAKAAILVPSPNVAEDHQTKNALALVQKNAAHLVTDQKAKEILIDEAIALLKDDEKREELSKNIFKLAKPNAANDIANEVLKLSSLK